MSVKNIIMFIFVSDVMCLLYANKLIFQRQELSVLSNINDLSNYLITTKALMQLLLYKILCIYMKIRN